MTSSIAHMLPDVNEVLEESLEHNTFPDTGRMKILCAHHQIMYDNVFRTSNS